MNTTIPATSSAENQCPYIFCSFQHVILLALQPVTDQKVMQK